MKKALFLGGIFLSALTGCITVFVPVDTPTPFPTIIPLSTASPPPASPTALPFAPFCAADPLAGACSEPTIAILSKSCIKKIPYTLVGISPGSTLEVLDAGMTCKDEKERGRFHQYSCSGQQLHSYRIKVCNPACTALLTAESGQCPPGYGFNESANCCWPLGGADAGCVTYKVDIGGCK